MMDCDALVLGADEDTGLALRASAQRRRLA